MKDQGEDEGKQVERRIVLLTVILTIDPKQEQLDHYGYQEPLPQDQVEEFKEYTEEYEEYGEDQYYEGHGSYNHNKGGEQQEAQKDEYEADGQQQQHTYHNKGYRKNYGNRKRGNQYYNQGN